MKTPILRGSKQEIADSLARINGEVREAIVFVEEPAPATPPTGTQESEDIFAQMRPFMVDPPHVDDARAAIYSRAEGWLGKTLPGVIRLTDLTHGRDSYGSPPINMLALRGAARLLAHLAQDAPVQPTIVPVPGGGIQLEWQVGQRGLEIEVRPRRPRRLSQGGWPAHGRVRVGRSGS